MRAPQGCDNDVINRASFPAPCPILLIPILCLEFRSFGKNGLKFPPWAEHEIKEAKSRSYQEMCSTPLRITSGSIPITRAKTCFVNQKKSSGEEKQNTTELSFWAGWYVSDPYLALKLLFKSTFIERNRVNWVDKKEELFCAFHASYVFRSLSPLSKCEERERERHHATVFWQRYMTSQ